ncbi:unnamed protein product, partial [Closterium sp. NIES-53]
ASSQVAASGPVTASGQLAASCSCRVLTHQTQLWHHQLDHPSQQHLRSMHSCLLVSDLPKSLPPLPRSLAPPCLPCVEGRQRAAPHSSEFPPTTAPLQTLHMDVWGPARVRGTDQERYFLLIVDDYSCYTTVFPLRSEADVNGVLIPWICAARHQLRERFRRDLPVACTSIIHAAAPHFLWPFVVRYAAHKLNLWPRVSLPETSPTLRWTREVGDASAFQVWGALSLVRDTTASKLSPRTLRCAFLGFPTDATPWVYPHASHPVPLEPLFLVPVPPPVGPLPLQGPSHSGAETGGADTGVAASSSAIGAVGDPTGGPGVGQPSRLETLSPQQINEWIVQRGRPGGGGYSVTASGAAGDRGTREAVGAGGARGAAGAGLAGGATGAGGAGAASTGGAGAASPGGAGATSPGGTAGAVGAGGAAGAGGAGAGGSGGAGAAGASGAAGAGGATGATGTRGAGGAGTRGAGAGGTGAAGGTGTALRRPFFYLQPQSSLPPPDSAIRQVLSLPSSTGLTPPLMCPPTDQSQPQLLPGSPLPAPTPHTEVTESLTERREPKTRASTPVCACHVARSRPPAVPGTHVMALHPSSVPQRVALLSPLASSLADVPDPESDLARAASLTVTRLLATVVTDPDFESTAAFALSESVCPLSVEGKPALSSDVLEDRQFELECLVATLPRFVSMLLCPEGDPDALDIPTPRSYAEAIAGEYSSHWQTAMDAEMASWKSTGTYVEEVPPPGANIVNGMWIFRVKRPPGSPPAFKASREWHDTLRTTLVALGFAPSSTDPSLFLRTDTTLPPFYVLVYVVFVTTDTEALALVKTELQERHICTDLGELRSYLGLEITLSTTNLLHRGDVVHLCKELRGPLSFLHRLIL